jgi:hypothetical protein
LTRNYIKTRPDNDLSSLYLFFVGYKKETTIAMRVN